MDKKQRLSTTISPQLDEYPCPCSEMRTFGNENTTLVLLLIDLAFREDSDNGLDNGKMSIASVNHCTIL